MPTIRALLELSTRHLQHKLDADALNTIPGVVAHRSECGWLMWVPHDPEGHATHMHDPSPTRC